MKKPYSGSARRGRKTGQQFHRSDSLGQNFLVDAGAVSAIVEGAQIGENDLVIEIGPGMGALTKEAAARARRLVAVEIDRHLAPFLTAALADMENIDIIWGDILRTDLREIIRAERDRDPDLADVRILGNLPYYITTPIIMKILEEEVPAKSLTVMMQREVARRIDAGPGTKEYGALTVAVQYYCDIVHLLDVPRHMFDPQPQVDSTVLRLDIRSERPVELLDKDLFFAAIRAAFGQRRKTLRNALQGLEGMDKTQVMEVLRAAGIDPGRRGETLDIGEFAELANRIKGRRLE